MLMVYFVLSFSKELENDEKFSFLDILITKSESRNCWTWVKEKDRDNELLDIGGGEGQGIMNCWTWVQEKDRVIMTRVTHA